MQRVTGQANWFCGDFSAAQTGLTAASNHFERQSGDLFFDARADDYRLLPAAARRMTVASAAPLLDVPAVPGLSEADALRPLAWQYHHPASGGKRPEDDKVTAGAPRGKLWVGRHCPSIFA